MKDPLHDEKTSYEVLGVAADVTAEGLHGATKARPPDADLTAWQRAYRDISDASERAKLDLLLYDDGTLARLLGGQDVQTALQPPARTMAAAAWRAALTNSFDAGRIDLEGVHALGVLSFWTGERAFRDGAVDDAAWSDAFGAFALLSRRSDQLGPRFAAVPPERLTDIVRNLLTQRLKKLSSRNGQETPAARDKLETLWNAELAAAALLDEIAREHGDTRFAGGPLFLRSIDRLDQFRAWLRGIPAGSRRDELARRFSSNARVAALAEMVSGGAAGAATALQSIESLPAAERNAPEVRALEAEARVLYGHDRLNDGKLQEGLKHLEQAVALAPERPLPAEVLKKIEEVCVSEGNAIKGDDAAAAMEIWERGYKLHPGAKNLGVAIGKVLVGRGARLVQETWDGFQRGVISAPAAKQAIAAGIAFLERAHRLGIKEAQGLHAQAFSILKMIEPAFQPREDPPPVEVRRPVSPPGASPGIARPPVAPPSPVPRPPVRRNPPVSSPRHVVSPPAFTRTAPPSWSHRACSLLAGAWLALGASTALALVSGYDVEFLGADLFSPLDPIWRGGGSRFGLMVFVLIPVLLWLAGRWLTAREAGRRLVDRATRPVRFIGVAWMLVVGTLLVDETAAVFSDHLLPRNAFRALGEPLGALGLIGVFALAALFALPLLLRWSVTARRPG